MTAAVELKWLITLFSNSLDDIWAEMPDEFRPVIVLDSARCDSPLELVYTLLEAHLQSFGHHLLLDTRTDAILVGKLDELRVICRFIDHMSTISPCIFHRPIISEGDRDYYESCQDLHIWKAVRRVCLEALAESKLNLQPTDALSYEAISTKYRLCFVDSCQHAAHKS